MKSFTFFERDNLQTLLDLECCCSGRNHVYVGDQNGIISQLNRQLSVLLSWKAGTSKILHLKLMKKKNMLISVSEDQSVPVLKIWNMDKVENSSPLLVRSIKIMHQQKIFPVTSIACLENMTQLAVGLENGVVVVYRGDLSRDRFTKSKIVHEGSEMVVSLGFREEQNALYIVTMAQILICITSEKDAIHVLDEFNGNGLCRITPQEKNQEMCICNQETITFYGPEGRGPCFMIQEDRSQFYWFKGYFVSVSRASKSEEHGSILTIYDLKSKFIAFRGSFGPRKFDQDAGTAVGEPIFHVFSEWGELFVVTQKQNVFRLRELDLQSKLEILYQQHLYPFAISLVTYPQNSIYAVKSEETEQNTVEINTRYADYMYQKGDFDGAMKQFIKTIGHLEPSYVIRKYLDAQKIQNLTLYLQHLHQKQLANPNHTTLLLNCYTKLQDLNKLDKFIETDIPFDVETAIRVCKQAGFYEQSLYLAKRHLQHQWYVKIQIEDLKNYQEAIVYLMKLDPSFVFGQIERYGYQLVNNVPQQMTQLLLHCLPLMNQQTDNRLLPEKFLHFYVKQPLELASFLESCLELKFHISLTEHNPIELDQIAKDSLKNICDSLLQVYMLLKQQDRVWAFKAKQLLEHPQVIYDLDQALVLCRQNDFVAGLLYLYSRLGMYKEMLLFFISKQQDEDILQTCDKFSSKEPKLWMMALDYFCNQPNLDNRKINKCLDKMDHPLVNTIDLLSRSKITLASVNGFIKKSLDKEYKKLEDSERSIQAYRNEITSIQQELDELDKPIVFQQNKCELCRQPLELPIISFLCKHSFHARCLQDADVECPIDTPEQDMILDLLKNQQMNPSKHALFLEKVFKLMTVERHQ
ncbi:hypothetical protein EDD86DRAFT_200662 [Gorgonomyces haynaldii]|nr:hypothetical protein EDD86DRAFT_200662 [Gorgonomyces haynaldii]